MGRPLQPSFEPLEGRKLLASAATASPTGVPVDLTGTLTVIGKDTTSVENDDGSTTLTATLTGRLGSLGKATGTWQETTDSFGDYQGPDTLQLGFHGSKGGILLSFKNDNPGKPKPVGHGLSMYQHAQALQESSGAFARDTEGGSIEVMVSSSSKQVKSLELISTDS